ncbi:L,D-transpeptidase family protein [Candidatus Bealeia paramacronuclearis]|uniref:L,D-transpeptidase family protein n=1 Tax=Candidatus Bealeia paramacronuclearis TaxID=1921001 RepID=A0ABZ2C6L5_9PROT|nr:L,D-transpeptidase family protein [Candidatus Bealeia paramacronuclearis]
MNLKKFKLTALLLMVSSNLSGASDSKDLFYKDRAGQMAWIENGKWNECAQTLMEKLAHVEEEGLDPQDYAPQLAALKKISISDPSQQMKADEILTSLTLLYISDMKGERLNPKNVDKTLYIKPIEVSEAQLLKAFFSNPKSCAWISTLGPARKEYQNLKELLAYYKRIQEQGGWPTLPKGVKLEKGKSNEAVQILRHQLVAQGALDSAHQSGDQFDDTVESALKTFQETHGIDPKGKIGNETLEALNTPVEKRIEQIIVSLERQRWLPDTLGARHIFVNIAGFELEAVDNNKILFTMPVIAGRAYRKTPSFYAQLNEVIFNPSWHVPYNIAVQDKLPKLQKNPNAFSGKGYNFYDSAGNAVSASSINWSSYSSGNFPYQIVQSPGSANALGKIRFTIDYASANLPNLDVYLHGTPEQNLFSKSERDFSSGCIRVENPAKLASFVLNDPQAWTPEKIKQESSGSDTKHIKLKSPLPVYITYFTVWKDEQGRAHFVKDLYGQDKEMWNALQQRRKPILPSI